MKANSNKPLNPGGARQYYIICTHCHYDHLGGITHFLEGGTTQIIASAAGRNFIESDLERHGLFDSVGKPEPYYKVTQWAEAFTKLTVPGKHGEKPIDLGITILQTPGHTPDELAWYDHEEMHLYVGDSMYEEGEDQMPIIWPAEGNLVEWVFSLDKMLRFVQGKNVNAAAAAKNDDEDWVEVARRVKLGAGHQTHSADAEEFLWMCKHFLDSIMKGSIPVASKSTWRGEAVYLWREKDGKSGISFKAPVRLMKEAYDFFGGTRRHDLLASHP